MSERDETLDFPEVMKYYDNGAVTKIAHLDMRGENLIRRAQTSLLDI